MLAVQPPGMGSSKPPNLEMPFGYSFDTSTSNFPFPSPTAPAPGPSLLDDNESRFLDSFFDGVSSDHFDYNLFTNAQDGTEAGFGWDELPPTFMGTTSSFGQQPQIGVQEPPSMNFNTAPPKLHTHPSIPPTTTADVLAAATVLQNGSAGRPHSIAEGSLYHPQDMYIQPSNGHVRPQSISQFPATRPYSGNHERTSSNDYMRDPYYTNMVFGNPVESNSMQRNANQKLDIRWGSDASFSTPQGFVAPNHRDKDAEVERAQMQSLDHALKLVQSEVTSADNSQPASPISAFPPPRKPQSSSYQDDEVDDSRPRKRRKSKYQEEAEDDDNLSSQLSGIKKRRTLKKEKDPPAESESSHKRRKSVAASAAGKAARENLTEDQKRENHIRSEQKRRTLIREGFEDLGELVPGLRGGGFSKSAVLIMAADWLEDLLQGNEALRAQLDQLEGR